ncbi:hypothetical protein NLI96_g9920 [Meripilus lineatus]|uniref:Uncharacterized protein n=1 Tax=Meripilus lineatus TaxID=2056292 RepID=A0AAD5UZ13_9APHY|nr:hypothetical protein NLI96_g9920 [Physisporinus lineatus]
MKPDGYDLVEGEERERHVHQLGAVIPDCLDPLRQYHIFDVEVEFRRLIVARCMQLQAPDEADVCPDARYPLTTAVGHAIGSDSHDACGSLGFFFTTEGKNNRPPLVTSRYVLLDSRHNNLFDNRDNTLPLERFVLLGRDEAFQFHLEGLEKPTNVRRVRSPSRSPRPRRCDI